MGDLVDFVPCPSLEEQLCAREHELSAYREAAIRRHAWRCRVCRTRWDEYEASLALSRGDELPGAGPKAAEARLERFLIKLKARQRELGLDDVGERNDVDVGSGVAERAVAGSTVTEGAGAEAAAACTIAEAADEIPREAASVAALAAVGRARWRPRLAARPATAATLDTGRIAWRAFRRSSAVAAVIPFLVAGDLVSRPWTGVVRAEELLARAVQQEQSHPRHRRQPARTQVTPVLVRTSAGATSDTLASIASLLTARHFDPRQPLCMACFTAWHASLPSKHDQVTKTYDQLVLHTTNTGDLIREAYLFVRSDDYQPVRQILIVAGIGQVDTQAVLPLIPRIDDPPPPPPPTTVTVQAPAIDRETLQQAELDARLVLARAGFDLRDAVRYSSTTDAVRIEATVASADEKQAWSARLANVPHLEVALRESLANADAAPAQPSTSPTLSRWLRNKYKNSSEQTVFITELVELTSSVKQRLGVLRLLALRYTDAELRTLSPAAQATLQRLLDLHYRALSKELDGLDTRFGVLFGSTPRILPVTQAPTDWSRRTGPSLSYAVALNRELDVLLADDDPTADPRAAEQSAAVVTRTFQALWNAVNARPSARAAVQ